MKVAITTSSFATYCDEPLKLLQRAGCQPVLNPHGRKLTAGEAADLLRGCVGVVAGTEPLTEAVLAGLPELRAISRCGVGLDNVDLAAAARLGVKVRSTPDAPTAAVAELTLGLILDLLRRISLSDRLLRQGVWRKNMGSLLLGKRVGLVGFGRIGQAVARLAASFGAAAAYADPAVTDAGAPRMELGDLLAWADIVSLHCSAGEHCALIGEAQLALMRPGALLINCARGGLADERALAAALRQGRLAGAALDVFGREPYAGELTSLDNVVLTPHVGSYAREARIAMETEAARNLVDALLGQGDAP
ncbi:MAG: phosphoglycerate dehydrogenase [Desulfovibrionaceae bacterium]|nr:phosphoglycerate dehydrogenase [Desulfovibrionaceae bacterium]MBF0512678.1 phosphoglycerate dehydrogenase [Desulfovibrionaceae bacterium]